jgi:hypothetical protein
VPEPGAAFEEHLSPLQSPFFVAATDRTQRGQTPFWQTYLTIDVRITATIPRSHQGDVMDHAPFEAVVASFQCANPAVLEERTPHIPKQARRRGNIQQDYACRSLEPLRHTRGIISLHHPSLRLDRLVMQGQEFFRRTWLPIRMRNMMKLIQMNHIDAEFSANGGRQCRLAAIGWPDDANAGTQL